MKNQNNYVAKEGWLLITILAIASAGFFVAGFFGQTMYYEGGFFLFCALFTAYFFRNPYRAIDTDERSVVAPADGKVIKVEPCHESDLLNADTILISIFMNVFNVHINRVPISGKIDNIKYHEGKFVNASFDKASTDNERLAMLIRTKDDKLVMAVQIAGLIARRIVSYVRKGDEIEKGKRYGLIRFGSRLDVYMPKDSEIVAKVGQKIKAGEVLGYLR